MAYLIKLCNSNNHYFQNKLVDSNLAFIPMNYKHMSIRPLITQLHYGNILETDKKK